MTLVRIIHDRNEAQRAQRDARDEYEARLQAEHGVALTPDSLDRWWPATARGAA